MTNLQVDSKRCAIVAGNGPILIEIDYTRLPPPPHSSCKASFDINNYDIFRCNQFYFEDKYYLGKKVKFAFTIPAFLFEHYYTHRTLTYMEEYEIDDIVVSNLDFTHIDLLYLQHSLMYDDVICGSRQLFKLKDFYTFVRYNHLYHDRLITSGIYVCAFAVALGYKEVYIAGIDLYSAKETYAFDTMQKNLLTIAPYFSAIPGECNASHTKELDIEALYFLEKHYGVKFYSICPNSPINEYIPLAPKQNNANFQIEERKKNSIKDMLIPPIAAYEKLNHGIDLKLQHNPLDYTKEIRRYKQTLRDNSIYKLYKDIIKLPKAIYHYIKGCRLSKRLKEDIG